MPTHVSNTYGTFLNQYCSHDASVTKLVSTETIQENDLDRRIKPTGKLVLSPTDGARQSISNNTMALWEEVYRPNGCTGGKRKRIHYSSSPTVANGGIPNAPTTQVTVKWRNKVKDLSLNLSSYVAEVKETSDLASSIVRNTIRAIKSARRGRVKEALRHIAFSGRSRPEWGDVSATWLLSSFAYGPMLSDLTDALTMLPAIELRDLLIKVVTSDKAVNEVTTKWSTSVNDFDCRDYARTEEKAVGFIRLLPNWKTFTGGNPLESLWEGTPLSFVVDYFTNVGDYLRNLDALNGVEVAAGTITRRELRERKLLVSVQPDEWVEYGNVHSQGYFRETATSRVVTGFDLEMPSLQFSSGASVKRLLNLTAIAHQQRLSRVR